MEVVNGFPDNCSVKTSYHCKNEFEKKTEIDFYIKFNFIFLNYQFSISCENYPNSSYEQMTSNIYKIINYLNKNMNFAQKVYKEIYMELKMYITGQDENIKIEFYNYHKEYLCIDEEYSFSLSLNLNNIENNNNLKNELYVLKKKIEEEASKFLLIRKKIKNLVKKINWAKNSVEKFDIKEASLYYNNREFVYLTSLDLKNLKENQLLNYLSYLIKIMELDLPILNEQDRLIISTDKNTAYLSTMDILIEFEINFNLFTSCNLDLAWVINKLSTIATDKNSNSSFLNLKLYENKVALSFMNSYIEMNIDTLNNQSIIALLDKFFITQRVFKKIQTIFKIIAF
jgi:hypothetical protein